MTIYTKEERERWIFDYHQSGMGVKQFCLQNGLRSANMYSWLKKLNSAPQSSFIEVKPTVPSSSATYVICYPNGVELKVMGRILISELVELTTKC